MLSNTLLLALAAGVEASVISRNQCDCSFKIMTDGAIKYPVGQTDNGQTKASPEQVQSQFCLNGNTISDSQGRGCWFTPPTLVLQCDVNQQPAQPFTIDCNGVISYNGSSTFYECPSGTGDIDNIHLQPDQGETCEKITLVADGCHAQCPTPTPTCPAPPPAQTVTVTQTVTASASCPSSTCPAELGQNYEYPHLIVPVDSSAADKAMGTSYFGEVSSTISSLFNFDIPAADSGKQCTLTFLFPEQSQLETSSYNISGSGQVSFDSLKTPATQENSYSNMPAVNQHLGSFAVQPGNAYTVAKFACPSGTAVGYKMSAAGGDLSLRYFQDYNPCPIGLYITVS